MDNDERVAYLIGDSSAPIDPAEVDELEALDELRGLLADPAVWAEPPADLEERVVAAIAAAAHAPTLHLAGADPALPVADPALPVARGAGVPVARGAGTRRRPRWVPYTILGAAAAAVLVVGLAIGLGHHSGPRAMQFAASLSGTKLSPGASGTVTLTRSASGWKIELHAQGLPRRDNGKYYQAWLKNKAGELVPIGTFNQPDKVTLWAGVAPSSYPTLTVTRQLANGDQSSSGQVVLIGAAHRTH